MGGRLPGNSNMNAYGIYVAAGLIPWISFGNSIARSSRIFIEKKDIISKVHVSLISLPIFITLSETIIYIITLSFLFLVISFTGTELDPQFLLFLPFIYLIQQIFALGLGILAGVFTVFVRDLGEVVGIILQLWFWFTPIVYISDIIPELAQKMLKFNPAFIFIDAYHQIFVFQEYIPVKKLLILCLVAHAVLALAYYCLKNLEKDVRDFL
jgi:lipopolysaccharide transport system permease protein